MRRGCITSLQDGSKVVQWTGNVGKATRHKNVSKKDHFELSDLCWAEVYREEHIAFIPKAATPPPPPPVHN